MASILLLDDEAMLRVVLADLLEEEGHTVVQGGDGLLAFDPNVISATDLIITDLYMPRVDGMEAILSARKGNPDLKIIVMSGGAEYLKHNFLPHMKDFGATVTLDKPFTQKDFLATVRAVLAVPAYAGNLDHQAA